MEPSMNGFADLETVCKALFTNLSAPNEAGERRPPETFFFSFVGAPYDLVATMSRSEETFGRDKPVVPVDDDDVFGPDEVGLAKEDRLVVVAVAVEEVVETAGAFVGGDDEEAFLLVTIGGAFG